MTLWEITDARDPFTLEAPNLAVAAVAVLMLGEGRFGVRKLGAHDAAQKMPAFMLRESSEHWCQGLYGYSLDALQKRVAQQHVGDLQRALASIQRGRPGERNIPDPHHDLETRGQQLAQEIARLAVKNTSFKKGRVH